MLDFLRRRARSAFSKGLLWFLVVVFMFFGLGYGFLSQVHPVATVNGKRILANDVSKEAEQLRQLLQQVYGANAPAMLKNINLPQEALDRIIENRLIANEAMHLGIHVSDAELQQHIASQRVFQQNGQFDFAQYQEVLRENGMLPAEYEAETRGQMIQDTLRQMVVQSVQVSDGEIRHAYNLQYQNVGMNYIEVPWANYSANVKPSNQQLQEFYKNNAEQFREPERVKIAFIHYEPLVMAAKYSPTDKQISDYYQTHLKSEFSHPEMADASHILIAVSEDASVAQKSAAMAKAEHVMKLAQARHADFKKLAAEDSDDPSTKNEGGDLGFFPRGQMIKPFNDAVFSMKPGEVRVVQTKFGFHVVKLNALKPAHTDTLAEATSKIIDDLRGAQGKPLAREAIDEDLSAALGGASLQNIAEKRGLDVAEPAPFARGESIQGIGVDAKIANAALALDKGQVRAIPEGDAPYLIQVVDKIPSHIPTLSQISQEVRTAYIRAQAERDAHSQAESLLEQIKSPADMAKVAGRANLTVQTVAPFRRISGAVPGIGQFPEATEAAAAVGTIPGVIPNVMEQDGNSYIIEVASRTDPDDTQWLTDKASFSDDYVTQRRAQVWQDFLDQLRSQAKIVINPDQLSAVSESSS